MRKALKAGSRKSTSARGTSRPISRKKVSEAKQTESARKTPLKRAKKAITVALLARRAAQAIKSRKKKAA